MAEHLEGLMGTSMDKIRELVDVNTIIGEPIVTPDGVTIIPISKVSFGFVSGGSDIPSGAPKEVFAGGAGAGVTIKPQAFIVVTKDHDVKLLELGAKDNNMIEGLITGVPELIAKVKTMFGGAKDAEDITEPDEEQK